MNRKTRQAQSGVSSVQWGPVFTLVGSIGCLGILGYAVQRNRARPEPSHVAVTSAPEPQRILVDVRTLAAAETRSDLEEPTAAPSTTASSTIGPSTLPADEVPQDVAKGTGVIAVKKDGRAKVAKVAAVADKPRDPNYVPFSPTPRQSAGPRVYGEPIPGYASSSGHDTGATIREASYGYRVAVGGIR
jgi:hypothetical protein